MPPPRSTSKKTELVHAPDQDHADIIKAAAQAWHGHSSGPKAAACTSEFDAHRLSFQARPSLFRIEALREEKRRGARWDFRKSLWDSYEIVNLSKKLERCLRMDDPFAVLDGIRMMKKRKESKNSLRKLFTISSRRFVGVDSFSSDHSS